MLRQDLAFVGGQVATVLTVYDIEIWRTGAAYAKNETQVATVLTVYGMRRRVRGCRGAKRR